MYWYIILYVLGTEMVSFDCDRQAAGGGPPMTFEEDLRYPMKNEKAY